MAAEWQIFRAGTLVYDTGTDTTNLQSMTVPSGQLSGGITYAWQVRYQDNYGDWSNYSNPTVFSIAVPEPGAIALISGAMLLSTRRNRSAKR